MEVRAHASDHQESHIASAVALAIVGLILGFMAFVWFAAAALAITLFVGPRQVRRQRLVILAVAVGVGLCAHFVFTADGEVDGAGEQRIEVVPDPR